MKFRLLITYIALCRKSILETRKSNLYSLVLHPSIYLAKSDFTYNEETLKKLNVDNILIFPIEVPEGLPLNYIMSSPILEIKICDNRFASAWNVRLSNEHCYNGRASKGIFCA